MNPNHTRILRSILALGLALGVSACAPVDRVDSVSSFETATRAAPVEAAINAPSDATLTPPAPSNIKIVAVNVSVPDTLLVSEANRYYPSGDIVWREDPIGNRHEQVKAIVAAGLTQGVAGIDGEREVILDVMVKRFHALTEKARYTVGGVHAIQFDMQIRDAATGEVLMEPHFIKADFGALGGNAAIAAEARGVTQKVRITNHLANVIRQHLGQNSEFVEHDTGLMGALNQL